MIPFYLQTLRDEFNARAERRRGYSLRAFAHYLKVEAPSLSAILKGKRRISKSKIAAVADMLNLSPYERELFIESNQSKPVKGPKRHGYVLDSEVHFRIIAEWEYYAILSLVETQGFKSDSNWIAERLGITSLRAQICVENLIAAKLVRSVDGAIVLSNEGLSTTEDIPAQALRKARTQDLELAGNAIELDVQLRDLSSSTFTVDVQDLPDLKEIIRTFRRKVMTVAERKKGKEVYKLSVQLFPLTKVGEK